MAKLDITVWQNDGYLYDYTVSVNDVPWSSRDNYLTEQFAIEAAIESGQEGWAVRGNN